jgi:hypothetical protein
MSRAIRGSIRLRILDLLLPARRVSDQFDISDNRFPTAQSFKLNVGTLCLAVVGNAIGLSLINRVGRRRLFLVGMATCCVDCLCLGICSVIPGQKALWGQASFTMIYMLAFMSGIGPVAYALCGELGSAKLRAKTVGFGMAVHNISVGKYDFLSHQPLGSGELIWRRWYASDPPILGQPRPSQFEGKSRMDLRWICLYRGYLGLLCCT